MRGVFDRRPWRSPIPFHSLQASRRHSRVVLRRGGQHRRRARFPIRLGRRRQHGARFVQRHRVLRRGAAGPGLLPGRPLRAEQESGQRDGRHGERVGWVARRGARGREDVARCRAAGGYETPRLTCRFKRGRVASVHHQVRESDQFILVPVPSIFEALVGNLFALCTCMLPSSSVQIFNPRNIS